MGDKQFVDGMRVSRPERAPEWVIVKLGIKRDDMLAWLEAQPGEWVNVEILRSRGGALYAAVEERRGQRESDDKIPF